MPPPKRRLGRLDRIRALEEDLARTAVEAALLEADPDPRRWRQAESEAQIHRVLAVRHSRALPALEKEAAASREQYLERRKERQKLEKLLTKTAEEERIERERRSAASVAELFQTRRWHESHEQENRHGDSDISSP